VTVQPPVHQVNKGNQSITWVPFASQDFTFTSLSFANNPSCFNTPNISSGQITVQDNNQNTGSDVDYPYTIVVTSNGQQYSSATLGAGADPGSPTIRNK
jgi:hypothetical protein